MKEKNIKLLNVCLLGFSFLLIFTGFNTVGQIQQLIFNSAKDQNSDGFVEGFNGDSFTSLAVIYLVFAAANWIAPSFIAVAGPRLTMFIGSITYLLYMGQLLYPNTLLLYTASILVGIGAPLLWTAQGNFLTLNSDNNTLPRNSGLFWAIFRLSGVFGNSFAFTQFKGLTSIGESVRMRVGGVLLGVACMGTIVMLMFRPTPWVKRDNTTKADSPIKAFISAVKLFVHHDMLLLIPTGIFIGISVTFSSSVYATCLGFTQAFGSDAKSLAAISAITLAAADILTSLVISWFRHRSGPSTEMQKIQESTESVTIIMVGLISSLVAYVSIFFIIPSKTPLGEAPEDTYTYIYPNKYVAISCSFLLGITSSCFSTQTIAILGKLWYSNSSPAFAFFKFIQSLSAAVAFFYSSVLSLEYQLAVLVVTSVVGTITFCIVLKCQNLLEPPADGTEEEAGACIQQT